MPRAFPDAGRRRWFSAGRRPVHADHPDAGAGCGPERALTLRTPTLVGSDVQELQERLKTLGFGPQVIDGIYGPKTAEAVRRFSSPKGCCPTASWEWRRGRLWAPRRHPRSPPHPGPSLKARC